MQKMEAECPNTFYLMLGSPKMFDPRNWVSQPYHLYLVCQHPSSPHGVGEGYLVRQSEDWWTKISPWLNHLIQFLKFAVPMAGKAAGVAYDEIVMKDLKSSIELMEEITKNIPELPALDSMKRANVVPYIAEDQHVVGPALRVLHNFLRENDPREYWGDLNKIITPDGNILWLCSEHRAQYEVKPLILT